MHNEGMRHMWHCGTLYIFVFNYVFINEYLSQVLRKNLAKVVISEMAK